MVDIQPGQPQLAVGADSASRSRTLLIGSLAGLALAVLWSAKLVDSGIGQKHRQDGAGP